MVRSLFHFCAIFEPPDFIKENLSLMLLKTASAKQDVSRHLSPLPMRMLMQEMEVAFSMIQLIFYFKHQHGQNPVNPGFPPLRLVSCQSFGT